MQMMGGGGGPADLLIGGGFGGGGGRAGGGGNNGLRDDVEADLKLNDDQKTKLSALREKAQEKRREMMQSLAGNGGGGGGGRIQISDEQRKAFTKLSEDNAKELSAVLTPEQNKRLREIWVQTSGQRVLQNAEIAKELGISADQKTKIDDLFAKQMEATMALFQNRDLDQEERRSKMENNNKVLADEINKVLTETQKTKLKEMSGAPFKRSDA
jgi:Spy/CpxP family protein refolding chaperone